MCVCVRVCVEGEGWGGRGELKVRQSMGRRAQAPSAPYSAAYDQIHISKLTVLGVVNH